MDRFAEVETLASCAVAVNGLEGEPLRIDNAIRDQAVAASLTVPGSLASLATCSCHRSRYLFASASKSGGLEFSFVTRAFQGLFCGRSSVLLCIAQ